MACCSGRLSLAVRGTTHGWRAASLSAFNRRGAFDNLDDSEASIREMLSASFERVELTTFGSVAVFSATGPRRREPAVA